MVYALYKCYESDVLICVRICYFVSFKDLCMLFSWFLLYIWSCISCISQHNFFFCMHMCSKNPFRKPYAQWGLINCVLMKPVANRKALEGTDVVLRPFFIAGCNAYDNWLYAAQYVCMCLVLTLLFLNFWNNICENQSFYPVLEKQLMLIMSCNFCFSFIHVLPLFLLPIFPLQFLLILLVGVGVCILFLRKSLNY